MSMFVRPEGLTDAEWVKKLASMSEELASLRRQPGWELFKSYMESEKARVEQAVLLAKTGDEALKAAGGLLVLTGMTKWMDAVQEGLRQALQGDQK